MIITIIFNLEPGNMQELFNGKPTKEEVKKQLLTTLREVCDFPAQPELKKNSEEHPVSLNQDGTNPSKY